MIEFCWDYDKPDVVTVVHDGHPICDIPIDNFDEQVEKVEAAIDAGLPVIGAGG